jgi:hypothetical protein
MEEALRAALLASAGVAALIGDRIAWGLRPQGQPLPAISLTRVTGGYDYTLAGRVPTTRSLVQIDCWAGSYADAKGLGRAVLVALDTLNVAPFQGAFVEDERDDAEDTAAPQRASAGADRATEIHRTSLDVRVVHDSI